MCDYVGRRGAVSRKGINTTFFIQRVPFNGRGVAMASHFVSGVLIDGRTDGWRDSLLRSVAAFALNTTQDTAASIRSLAHFRESFVSSITVAPS